MICLHDSLSLSSITNYVFKILNYNDIFYDNGTGGTGTFTQIMFPNQSDRL